MFFYPKITLTLLNGFLLVLPMLLLRFGVPALVHREALVALDHFPPVLGRERIALKIYLVTNTFIVFSPLLAHIISGTPWQLVGWFSYALGMAVLGLGLWNFSTGCGSLMLTGMYRFSRNPIYMGYFLIFIGVALLIGSWFHLALTLVYQVAVHYLILSEERWCQTTYGQPYLQYLKQVRRYF